MALGLGIVGKPPLFVFDVTVMLAMCATGIEKVSWSKPDIPHLPDSKNR